MDYTTITGSTSVFNITAAVLSFDGAFSARKCQLYQDSIPGSYSGCMEDVCTVSLKLSICNGIFTSPFAGFTFDLYYDDGPVLINASFITRGEINTLSQSLPIKDLYHADMLHAIHAQGSF